MIRVIAPLLVCFVLGGSCFADVPQKQPIYERWKIVARADVIVRGRPVSMAPAVYEGKIVAGSYTAELSVDGMLKGDPTADALTFRFSNTHRTDWYNRLKTDMGKEIVVFLSAFYDGTSARFFLLDDEPFAIVSADPAVEERIRKEVANQDLIRQRFPWLPVSTPDPLHYKVKRFVDKLLASPGSREEIIEREMRRANASAQSAGPPEQLDEAARPQQEAVNELDRMGWAAVPSLVRLLDDRRPLPTIGLLFFRNVPTEKDGPMSWARHEAYNAARPSTVSEAIARVLNVTTGEFFDYVRAGDKPTDRNLTGWRTFLYYTEGKPHGLSPAP